MTREEANRIIIGYIKACNEDDFVALERFSYEEVIEAMRVGAEALSKPSLPSNLDEAARHYLLNEHCSPLNEIMHQADLKAEMTYHKDIESSFKAGAEWMARQGETIEKHIIGTDVIVQIRKK